MARCYRQDDATGNPGILFEIKHGSRQETLVVGSASHDRFGLETDLCPVVVEIGEVTDRALKEISGVGDFDLHADLEHRRIVDNETQTLERFVIDFGQRFHPGRKPDGGRCRVGVLAETRCRAPLINGRVSWFFHDCDTVCFKPG